MCIKTLVGHVICLKRPITAPFERSEPFHLLRLMGVSVPSLHIESTDSMISADKAGKSVPMERNVAYELHHPQPQRTSTEQTHVPPVYEVVKL